MVAFDFDGTLTIKDSFTGFLRWRAGPRRYALGLLRLIPAALAYLLHRDRGVIKAAAARVWLRGLSREALAQEARAYADKEGVRLFRPDAVAAFRGWLEKPVRVVIVTASPEEVVAPFAAWLGADELLGTRLAFDEHDRVTGAFDGSNCRGEEKMARLRTAFGPDLVLLAAYGDTAGDHQMIAAAEVKGYRVFTGRPAA